MRNQRPSRRHLLQASAAAVAVSWTGGFTAARPILDETSSAKSLKLGLASYTARKLDLDKTIGLAKRVGLKYICLKSMHLPLDSQPETIAKIADRIRKSGLNLYGCGVVTLQKQAQVDQAFNYAKEAGMELIVIAPSVEMLPSIEKKVKETGIAVAIHNHGPTDKVFPTPESVYEKVKDLDKRVGLCIDIGHTVRVGADLIASTKKYGDRLYDLHMKDVTEAAAKGKEVPVGRGIIDIPKFLKTLADIKYQGRISFEYEPEPDDPLPGLAESVGYTRGVLATL